MILEAKHIYFSYGLNDQELYSDFNFTAKSDERVGLVAPSGFGKTTLCKLLSGYEIPLSGEILLDGKPLSSYKGSCPIQLIWQHPHEAVNPRLKMRKILAEGGNLPSYILDALGIKEEWLDRYPSELSGGELQRFCIARVLGENTKFILADEITTMLDMISQRQIWNFLIEETEKRGIGLVIVSHLPSLLDKICTRQIELNF